MHKTLFLNAFFFTFYINVFVFQYASNTIFKRVKFLVQI